MRFNSDFLEELRERIPPSEIIGRKVSLKPKGRGEFTGLCPFHNEKTPSFTVSDDKGFYHCFGCSAHGDIIKFTMDSDGLTFSDAVEKLAGIAGLPLPKISREDDEKFKKVLSIYDVMEKAALWFQKQLVVPGNRFALEYLRSREMGKEVLEKFRLGFAPDSFSALKTFLLSEKVSEQLMFDAGLVVKNDRGEVYDKFRNRIIFPIFDAKGRVIAFGGRVMDDSMPKYLNSPETEIYKKGNMLYGWNFAKSSARLKNEVIVVEGYVDLIALNKNGIENVVASSGTALTERQLQILWSAVNEPTICLDGDAAGKRAMARIVELYLPLLKPGYSLKFVILPENMDPDDAIKNNGADFFLKLTKMAMPLSEIVWQIESTNNEGKTPEKKAALEKTLADLAGKIKDASVRNYYSRFFKDKLWQAKTPSRFKNKKDEKTKNIDKLQKFNAAEPEEIKQLEIRLIDCILNYPELLENSEIHEDFIKLEFSSAKLDKIRQNILETTSNFSGVDKKGLEKELEEAGFGLEVKKILRGSKLNLKNYDIAFSSLKYLFARFNFIYTENMFRLRAQSISSEKIDEFLTRGKHELIALQKAEEKEKQILENMLENNSASSA